MNFRAVDESTEMLLTDYLEGTLDPARQQEIDEYLERHPREKQVIQQLRAQRQLLAELPRERVPGEVYEGVSGQIERSVLLSSLAEIGSSKTGAVRLRPARFALAAVVLMSMGLGVVIYIIASPTPAVRVASGGGDNRDYVAGKAVPAHPLEGQGAKAGEGTDTKTVISSRDPNPRDQAGVSATPLMASVPEAESRGSEAMGAPAAPTSASGYLTGPPGTASASGPADADGKTGGAGKDVALRESQPPTPTPALAQPGADGGGPLPVTASDAQIESPSNQQATSPAGGTAGTTGTHSLTLYARDKAAARERIEQFLRTGGWSFAATGPAPDEHTAGDATLAAKAAGNNTMTLLVRVEADQVEALKSVLLNKAREETDSAPPPTTNPLTTAPATASHPAPAAASHTAAAIPSALSPPHVKGASRAAATTRGASENGSGIVLLVVNIESEHPASTTRP